MKIRLCYTCEKKILKKFNLFLTHRLICANMWREVEKDEVL